MPTDIRSDRLLYRIRRPSALGRRAGDGPAAVSRHDPGRRLARTGPSAADLAVLRGGRAELRLHEGRPKAARGTRRAPPGIGLLPYAQPADLRRRHAGAKWGSTGAYREDAQGRPIYNWSIVDRIFDTYLERGVRPYVQIGFMPRELSVKPEPYQHHWTPTARYNEIFTGWAYPPKDYAKWGELVYQWVRHCVEKYGRAEVESWYWEIWNEANIGYWRGTPEEFRKLHDTPSTPWAGPADGSGRRRRLRRQRRPMDAGLPRTLPPRDQPRDRQGRHADRLRLVPRQGLAELRGRPRADGHRQATADYRTTASASSPRSPS